LRQQRETGAQQVDAPIVMESSVSFGIGGTRSSFVANVVEKPFWTSSQKIDSDCGAGSSSAPLAANFAARCEPT
jgi:hypothetical protein